MSSTVIVPDGGSHTGALTGGASIQAVLLDLDDATYVTLDASEYFDVTFTDATIPAGAVVTRVDAVLRATRGGGGGGLNTTELTVDGEEDTRTIDLQSASFVQWVAASVVGDNDPDATTVRVTSTVTSRQVSLAWCFVYYVEQPVVNVTAPTGTLTDDNQPTVEWTNTLDVDGGGQFGVNVRIFEEPGGGWGGFDPDVADEVYGEDFFGTETEWQVPGILDNGTYRAYVKIAQLVNGTGHNSDWDYSDFEIDVPLPAQPTLLLTGEADDVRTRIDLAANSGAADTDGVQVQVRIDGEWRDVRTPLGSGRVACTTTATAYDFEGPNRLTYYRARAYAEDTGSFAYSSWVEETCTRGSTKWGIKHPTQWVYNVAVDLRSFPSQSRASNDSVHQPLGSSTALAIGDGTRGPETGTVVIRCPDDPTMGLVQRIASLGSVVLLQPPADHHERDRWVSLGNENTERLIDKSWSDERNVSYEWTEVARPDGDLADGDPGGLYPSDYLYPSDDRYPS